jgi:hypothetical protein
MVVDLIYLSPKPSELCLAGDRLQRDTPVSHLSGTLVTDLIYLSRKPSELYLARR